jgi:hypothetical protein
MAGETKTSTLVQTRVERITDEPHAPILFFDAAPNYGFLSDIVNVTLTCMRFLPAEDSVIAKPVVVAHLRCGRETAIALRNAIDNALLIAAKPPEGSAN